MQELSNRPLPRDPGGLNFVALEKGGEKYILVYEDAQTDGAYRTLGRWASSTELSFSWWDAAKMHRQIRKNAEAAG